MGIPLNGRIEAFSYQKEDGHRYIKQDLFLGDRFIFGIEYGPLTPELIQTIMEYRNLENPENVEAVAKELMPELEKAVETMFRNKVDELRRNPLKVKVLTDFKVVERSITPDGIELGGYLPKEEVEVIEGYIAKDLRSLKIGQEELPVRLSALVNTGYTGWLKKETYG